MSNPSFIENKVHSFFDNGIISISVILVISIVIKILSFPFNVPLTLDALDYFFSASDIAIVKHLTSSGAHDGWPIFLSVFFAIFRSDNFLDYMTLQRWITVGLSTITIIPVYFLCKRFVEKPYAIVATAIFAFDPRLIQNSFLGITEPLYILLLSSSFVLFFSSKTKLTFISFVLVGLSCTIRTEGFFVFIPMITMFYVRNRREKKIILKVILAAAIFILLVLPIALFRINTQGNDLITSYLSQGSSQVLTTSHSTGTTGFLKNAVENVVRLGGWSLVPIFCILVPLGFYFFIKEKNIDRLTILVIIVLMFFPVLYAFSLNNADLRYMYPLFPLFSVVSALTIKKGLEKARRQNIALLLIIGLILLVSVAFIEFKKFDYEHDKDAFSISYKVVSLANGVNSYYPEDSYIAPAEIPTKWPALKSSINFKTTVISTDGFDSLTSYLQSSKKAGLTHLVLDGQKNRPSFLNDVFDHPNKYTYLTEVYDSSKYGFKYEVKIYQINYNKFEELVTSNK